MNGALEEIIFLEVIIFNVKKVEMVIPNMAETAPNETKHLRWKLMCPNP